MPQYWRNWPSALIPKRWQSLPGKHRLFWLAIGYLLDEVDGGAVTGPLAALVADSVRDYPPLEPSLPAIGAVRDAKWSILVNVHLEPDL